MPSSRGSAQPGDRTRVSSICCTGRQAVCHERHQRERTISKRQAGGSGQPAGRPQGGPLSWAGRGGRSRARKRPRSSRAFCLERLPAPHKEPRGRPGTLEREGTPGSGKELPGRFCRDGAPPRDSRRGGCNKADLNCVDCKTATMRVIGDIYESFTPWLQNGVLVKHFLSLEIIKEMNHKLDYKLIFTYFTKTHDNKRVSGEHLCKFMCNKKN